MALIKKQVFLRSKDENLQQFLAKGDKGYMSLAEQANLSEDEIADAQAKARKAWPKDKPDPSGRDYPGEVQDREYPLDQGSDNSNSADDRTQKEYDPTARKTGAGDKSGFRGSPEERRNTKIEEQDYKDWQREQAASGKSKATIGDNVDPATIVAKAIQDAWLEKRGPIDKLTGGRVKIETDPAKQAIDRGRFGYEVHTRGKRGGLGDKITQALGGSEITSSQKQRIAEGKTKAAGLEYAAKEWLGKATRNQEKLNRRAGLRATRDKIDYDAMSSSQKAAFNKKADSNMIAANKRDPGLMYSAPQNVTSQDNRRYRAEIAAADTKKSIPMTPIQQAVEDAWLEKLQLRKPKKDKTYEERMADYERTQRAKKAAKDAVVRGAEKVGGKVKDAGSAVKRRVGRTGVRSPFYDKGPKNPYAEGRVTQGSSGKEGWRPEPPSDAKKRGPQGGDEMHDPLAEDWLRRKAAGKKVGKTPYVKQPEDNVGNEKKKGPQGESFHSAGRNYASGPTTPEEQHEADNPSDPRYKVSQKPDPKEIKPWMGRY